MWFSEAHAPGVRLCVRVDRQLYSAESRYQRIDIFQTPEFGRVLALDGRVMLTEKDAFIYHEMITHPAFAVSPRIRDVLVVGGGDGGAVGEILRYESVRRVDVAEIDHMVVHAARGYLPRLAAAFDDMRVRLFIQDGVAFVRRRQGEYDLIVVDSTGPEGPGEGLFTREFFGCCSRALREEGIVLIQLGGAFYEESLAAVARAFGRAGKCFPVTRLYQAHVPTYPSGLWLFGFFSKGPDPLRDLKAKEWQALGVETRYYNAALHRGAFALPTYIARRLGAGEEAPEGPEGGTGDA